MKHRWLVILFLLLLSSCREVTSSSGPALRPTLLADRLGQPQDLVPTSAEITAAQLALKPNGFIGIVACNLSSEYHSTVSHAAEAQAQKWNLPVQVFDSETKADRQNAAIETFVAKGAKAIALCELDPKVVKNAVQEAADKGVYILQYAGRDPNVNGISISAEDADLGCAAGEIAGGLITREKGGQANVAILDYPDLPNVVVRANKIEECLKQKAPGAKIIGHYLGGTAEFGLKSLENALQAHPEIDVVASINDAGAYGAIKALEAAGKDPHQTIVVGIDAEAQAKDLIKQGKFFRGTVDTAPAQTGEMVIQAVVKLLAGSTAPKNVRVPVIKFTEDSVK